MLDNSLGLLEGRSLQTLKEWYEMLEENHPMVLTEFDRKLYQRICALLDLPERIECEVCQNY